MGCGAASTALLSSLKASVAGEPAGRVALVEVGAHGGFDEIEDLAQDAILIQARHAGERAFDPLAHGGCGRLPVLGAELAVGIETQVEELEQIAHEAAMARERIGEVAQAERGAELPQIGAVGTHAGRLAPVGAGTDHQPVEAVVVGLAANHGDERGLEALVQPLELDRGAAVGLEHHVVQRHLALPVGKARADLVGALVDGREPRFSSTGTRSERRMDAPSE